MATAGGTCTNTDTLSDETFDLHCSVCQRKGKNCEAEKYCEECNDYYCLVCVRVHEDVPLLSGHKVLDKGQFKTGSDQTIPAAPTERCNKHNYYYIDMYCQTHDDVGCVTCFTSDHRFCKDIFNIPEFLQNNATIPTSKETAQTLKGVAKILMKTHNDLQHEKQKLLKAKADTLENIRKFRIEINESLDKLEQNSINEIESRYKALTEEIEKATNEVQAYQSNIKLAQNRLASAGNNVSQFFVNAKTGNRTARMASNWIEENKTQTPVVDIDFEADQRISKFLEEINTLGNVIQRDIEDGESLASSASNLQDQMIISSQSTRQKKYPVTSGSIQQRNVLLQGHRKKNYTVEVKSDMMQCNVPSVCALEDGTIILADNLNNKLKCLDSSTFTVTDYCDLPGQPWQACAISKQEVAVCLPWQQVVQFVSVGSRMTKTTEINTDFDCHGLAYANDNLYIADSDTSIYIYSMKGRKLRQFKVNLSELNMQNLAVSKDGSRIYVTDYNKGLIVLDRNGQVVGHFNGPQLKGASGCYLTETGSLLVCGEHSHNVLQFGPEGELIGEVVKSDRNKKYQAVCCNQQMSKLIVCPWSNVMKVYDLE